MKKPSRASGYDQGYVRHVRSTCLYVATKLGDLIDDVVVIGGLVPSLLIDQRAMQSSDDLHVGTLDLDVGLALAVFDEQRYAALTERLRQAGSSAIGSMSTSNSSMAPPSSRRSGLSEPTNSPARSESSL